MRVPVRTVPDGFEERNVAEWDRPQIGVKS